jgi:hypothetical protein
MNANENKQMDNLIRKVIEKAPLESPSFDFTARIISQLEHVKQSETTVYRPLISKTGWLAIFVAVAALIIYARNDIQSQTTSSFGIIDFSFLVSNRGLNTLSRLSFSNTVLYAFGALSIMLLLQVSILTSHFNKRFEG